MPKKIIIKRFVTQQDPISEIVKELDNLSILDVSEILPLITPGSQLRIGLDEIICAENGAIIVLGTNDFLESIIRGGININTDYSHSRLFELSKMDGAIIISNDLSKILYANVHLVPDKNIFSDETGIRHRSAQQTAIETNRLVISISKRRKLISLYYKNKKYVIQDLNLLLVKANNLLNHLEKYREQIDSELKRLDVLELDVNKSSLKEAFVIIQKILYFFRHAHDLEKLIIELGNHGTEISQSLYEYSNDLDDVLFLIVKDYSLIEDEKKIEEVLLLLKNLDLKTIINDNKLSDIICFSLFDVSKQKKFARGYRLLSFFPLSYKNTDKIIFTYKSINNILKKSPEEISEKGDVDISLAKTIKIKLKEISKKVE